MPLEGIEKQFYNKGYYAGYRKATLDHLGQGTLVCAECGSSENLEIDHIKPLWRKSRRLKDLNNLKNLRILCKECNDGRKGEEKE